MRTVANIKRISYTLHIQECLKFQSRTERLLADLHSLLMPLTVSKCSCAQGRGQLCSLARNWWCLADVLAGPECRIWMFYS